MELYLGTSGWAYPAWKPGFYPPKTSFRAFLAYYATRFRSVEVNFTFRSANKLSRELASTWIEAVPPGFLFSFKAPWQTTHSRERLQHTPELRTFLDSLKPFAKAGKLGCILFQLPPTLKGDPALLRRFLKRWRNPAPTAFEFRHPSWFTEGTYEILREKSVALCVAESHELTTPEVATAPHTYYRFRLSHYSRATLQLRAETIAHDLHAGRTVFAYQKHEESPITPRRALTIARNVESLLAPTKKG